MRLSSQNANSPSHPGQIARGYKSPPKSPRLATGGFVKVQAYAKINLFLDVLGKRQDGYHDIVSVMQTVDLCDDITIFTTEGDFRLTCNDPGLPTDESNLIVKAAKILISRFGIRQNLEIELVKRIPTGAGLAGGSSDCAATLLGINELLDLKIPFEKLLEIGKTLGADVPFCLTRGTALAEGIGEKITPLPPHPECYAVLACPEIHVSTAEIFARIGEVKNVDRSNIINAVSSSNLPKIAEAFYNVFTPVTAALHPEISLLINEFQNLGALGASMSGTGSSVFAYFDSENNALKAFNKTKKSIKNVYICKPI